MTKWANAFFSLKVVESQDLGSHTLYIAELEDAEVLSSAPSCTYGYYQSTIKKSAPKPAVKKGWRCVVCGYIYEGETLPEDYVCPICKHGPEDFEYFEETGAAAPKAEPVPAAPRCFRRWEEVGVHRLRLHRRGGESPRRVPGVPRSRLQVQGAVRGKVTLAAEHEYGIYAKTVKNNDSISAEDKAYILEQLKANFTG